MSIKYMKEYPVGTKLVANQTVNGPFSILHIVSKNEYTWENESGYIKYKFDYNDDSYIGTDDIKEIIYPPQYQSPLWKVLNGEDIKEK